MHTSIGKLKFFALAQDEFKMIWAIKSYRHRLQMFYVRCGKVSIRYRIIDETFEMHTNYNSPEGNNRIACILTYPEVSLTII